MLLSLRKGELISIKFYQGREGKVLCRKKKKSVLPNTLPDPIPYLGLQFKEL